MKILVCIDDTDSLESVGTGRLAAGLAADMERLGMGTASFISRHQLFVHPDVPYTSHNSAMCFVADIDGGFLGELVSHAAGYLARVSAPGSDPGLCIAVRDEITAPEELAGFGLKAKRAVLTKADAYSLADGVGVHLSEHGGTGQGVIGALAGVGLRLGGNDGRIRGRLPLGPPGCVISVRRILMSRTAGSVRTLDGRELGPDEEVLLGEKVKGVLLGGNAVLPVTGCSKDRCGAAWRTCTKEELKGF